VPEILQQSLALSRHAEKRPNQPTASLVMGFWMQASIHTLDLKVVVL
jgi:hypothetical protein